MKSRIVVDQSQKQPLAHNTEYLKEKTRSFIAKAIIPGGVLVLLAVCLHAVVARNMIELGAAIGSMTTLMTLIVKHYFRHGDG